MPYTAMHIPYFVAFLPDQELFCGVTKKFGKWLEEAVMIFNVRCAFWFLEFLSDYTKNLLI